jgi:drug/metabolite transporter (DMT)-like permease
MAIAAGALFLGEELTAARVVGAIFVVLALVLLALFDRQPETVIVHQ